MTDTTVQPPNMPPNTASNEMPDADRPHRPVLPWLWRRIAFLGSMVVVGFVVFSGVAGLLQANSLDDRIADTRAEIARLQQDSAELAALVAWLDSDAYIERIAREDLGMVRPGEESFAVRAPQRGQLAIERSPWWANMLPPTNQEQP